MIEGPNKGNQSVLLNIGRFMCKAHPQNTRTHEVGDTRKTSRALATTFYKKNKVALKQQIILEASQEEIVRVPTNQTG